ncbi:MAG: hypothetical protein KF863_09800 [Rubrivivax sp.]|nr:hypothetical protein [Rubrivivax sp.]
MTTVDLVGWLAATLTLLTFVCCDMRRLRVLAICANVAFVAYGASADLMPVLALHLMLAPVNLWRLRELHRPRLQGPAPAEAPVVARAPR